MKHHSPNRERQEGVHERTGYGLDAPKGADSADMLARKYAGETVCLKKVTLPASISHFIHGVPGGVGSTTVANYAWLP